MLRVAYHTMSGATIPAQEVFKDHLGLAEYVDGCKNYVFVHLPAGVVIIPKDKIDYIEVQTEAQAKEVANK